MKQKYRGGEVCGGQFLNALIDLNYDRVLLQP